MPSDLHRSSVRWDSLTTVASSLVVSSSSSSLALALSAPVSMRIYTQQRVYGGAARAERSACLPTSRNSFLSVGRAWRAILHDHSRDLIVRQRLGRKLPLVQLRAGARSEMRAS